MLNQPVLLSQISPYVVPGQPLQAFCYCCVKLASAVSLEQTRLTAGTVVVCKVCQEWCPRVASGIF